MKWPGFDEKELQMVFEVERGINGFWSDLALMRESYKWILRWKEERGKTKTKTKTKTKKDSLLWHLLQVRALPDITERLSAPTASLTDVSSLAFAASSGAPRYYRTPVSTHGIADWWQETKKDETTEERQRQRQDEDKDKDEDDEDLELGLELYYFTSHDIAECSFFTFMGVEYIFAFLYYLPDLPNIVF